MVSQSIAVAFTLAIIITGLVYIYTKSRSSNDVLFEGITAPDFELLDETETPRKLSHYRGKKVILCFYPKDNTPDCTKEACQLRDIYGILMKNNVIVIGINYDTPASHANFKIKHHLPFILLSDSHRTVTKKYGAAPSVINLFFPQRKTLLLDESGKIIKIIPHVKLDNHIDVILKSFKIL